MSALRTWLVKRVERGLPLPESMEETTELVRLDPTGFPAKKFRYVRPAVPALCCAVWTRLTPCWMAMRLDVVGHAQGQAAPILEAGRTRGTPKEWHGDLDTVTLLIRGFIQSHHLNSQT